MQIYSMLDDNHVVSIFKQVHQGKIPHEDGIPTLKKELALAGFDQDYIDQARLHLAKLLDTLDDKWWEGY